MSNTLQQLNADLATIVEDARRGLVQITNGRRGGSAGAGTIWHPEGLVLTNAHVVQRPSLRVTLPDGRQLPARVLAHDKQLDLAALSVEANGLPTIDVGDSRRLRPGDWVLALGHPWGVTGAATAGVVIDVGRPLEMAALGRELVQVSLRVRPGNSGGPLVDVAGRLVGINMMMAGPQVGMAVPVHVVKGFLRHALAMGGKRRDGRTADARLRW